MVYEDINGSWWYKDTDSYLRGAFVDKEAAIEDHDSRLQGIGIIVKEGQTSSISYQPSPEKWEDRFGGN